MKYRLAHGMAEVDSPATWLRLAASAPALLWGPRALAAAPISRATRRRAERWWARRVVTALDIDLRIEGLDHGDGGPFVVLPLHESAVDPVALLHLPLTLRFALRDELLEWPYFGPYLRSSRQIVIVPEDGRSAYRTLLDGATDALAATESPVVFPQGTLLGIEADFQPGAFHLAAKLGIPLLPVVLTGGHRVWERPFGPKVRRGQSMAMRVLPPIPADRLACRGVAAIREDVQREMKEHALDGSMPAPRRFDPDRDGSWPGYRYDIDPAFAEVAIRT